MFPDKMKPATSANHLRRHQVHVGQKTGLCLGKKYFSWRKIMRISKFNHDKPGDNNFYPVFLKVIIFSRVYRTNKNHFQPKSI